MEHHIAEDLILCLTRNAVTVAWSPKDMTGINPEVAMHYLNVDPKVRPVK